MPAARNLSLVAAGLTAVSAAAVAYASRQIMAPAQGNPEQFLSRPRVPGQRVTVCLGASIIHGRVSVDAVELLRRRFPPPDHAFVNAAVNGDLAWNALQRLPSVIACDPDTVVVLVGTNDVLASLSPRVTRAAINGKHLPVVPTLSWYAESMSRIVLDLRQSTPARVGLCSLPVLGENLASEAGQRLKAYNAVIRDVAYSCGAAYLPVYERQADYLASIGRSNGAAYEDRPALVMAAGYERYLLGSSFDRISQRHGLVLTTDQIHMNSKGAGFIVDEIERFLLDDAGDRA
jgi:lysophospholipase L1-like esterase